MAWYVSGFKSRTGVSPNDTMRSSSRNPWVVFQVMTTKRIVKVYSNGSRSFWDNVLDQKERLEEPSRKACRGQSGGKRIAQKASCRGHSGRV